MNFPPRSHNAQQTAPADQSCTVSRIDEKSNESSDSDVIVVNLEQAQPRPVRIPMHASHQFNEAEPMDIVSNIALSHNNANAIPSLLATIDPLQHIETASSAMSIDQDRSGSSNSGAGSGGAMEAVQTEDRDKVASTRHPQSSSFQMALPSTAQHQTYAMSNLSRMHAVPSTSNSSILSATLNVPLSQNKVASMSLARSLPQTRFQLPVNKKASITAVIQTSTPQIVAPPPQIHSQLNPQQTVQNIRVPVPSLLPAKAHSNLPKQCLSAPSTSTQQTPVLNQQTPVSTQPIPVSNQPIPIKPAAPNKSGPNPASGDKGTPEKEQPASSSTNFVDMMANKLQIHMPLLSRKSSAIVALITEVNKEAPNAPAKNHCPICSMAFVSSAQLDAHLKRKSLILRYVTTEKGKKEELTFYNKCALLCDIRRKHKLFDASRLKTGYYLSSQDSKSASSESTSSSKTTGPKDEKCPECHEKIPIKSTSKSLVSQKSTVSVELQEHFQRFDLDIMCCKKCDIPVTNACQARAHARLHRLSTATDPQELVCPNCGSASFDDLTSFLVHLYGVCMHTMKCLGFRCLFCGHWSRELVSLFKHCASSHAGQENSTAANCVKCPSCEEVLAEGDAVSSGNSAAVAAKIVNHCFTAAACSHRPFSIREICKFCNRLFPAGSAMRSHIERVHSSLASKIAGSSTPFYCALCRKTVGIPGAVHIEEMHSSTPQSDTDSSVTLADSYSVVDKNFVATSSKTIATSVDQGALVSVKYRLCRLCNGLIDCGSDKIAEHIAKCHPDEVCPDCLSLLDPAIQHVCVSRGDAAGARKSTGQARLKQPEEKIPASKECYSYSLTCFQCDSSENPEKKVFANSGELSSHINTIHGSSGISFEAEPDVPEIPIMTVKRPQSQPSVFQNEPTSRAAKRSKTNLTPFICWACNLVCMSRGSLEAHERKCQRIQEMHNQSAAVPTAAETTSATSSRTIPPLDRVSSSSGRRASSTSSSDSSNSSNSDSLNCSLCSAVFRVKSEFLSHMSWHISNSNRPT